MKFENIVISPPDNYRFFHFVPSVINLYTLYTFRWEKSKNRLEVSFNKNVAQAVVFIFYLLGVGLALQEKKSFSSNVIHVHLVKFILNV